MNKRRNVSKAALATLMMMAAVLLTATGMVSCHKRLGPTKIQVVDSIRHYPPIVLGDDLDMVYVVRNVGDEILVITDIQPSCFAIECATTNVTAIPPGEETPLKFTFHSDKNTGLARHSIRIFGNIRPHGVAEIIFDTHVVRPSLDLSDYEEYYQKKVKSDAEHILDGRYSEKGYYTDSAYQHQ